MLPCCDHGTICTVWHYITCVTHMTSLAEVPIDGAHINYVQHVSNYVHYTYLLSPTNPKEQHKLTFIAAKKRFNRIFGQRILKRAGNSFGERPLLFSLSQYLQIRTHPHINRTTPVCYSMQDRHCCMMD